MDSYDVDIDGKTYNIRYIVIDGVPFFYKYYSFKNTVEVNNSCYKVKYVKVKFLFWERRYIYDLINFILLIVFFNKVIKMSKIGNVVGQHLEINRDAVGGDLANAVSALNNIWAAINNQSVNTTEATASLLLTVVNVVDMVSKCKFLSGLNVVAEATIVIQRIDRSVESLLKQLDIKVE